jgi:hypothetical protein
MPNGEDGPDSKDSGRFPGRLCPKCRGHDILCDLCGGARVISRFKAAAWFSENPEIRDTPSEFPSVPPPKPSGDGT